jgi:hypothetical protein
LQRPARIVGRHVSTVLHHRFIIPTYKTQKGCTGKDASPTCGFAASPRVGPGANVGTLKIGYPCIQALSKRPKTRRRTCPRVPRLPSPGTRPLRRHVPRDSSSRHQGLRQLRDCHMPYGLGSRLLTQDSSRTAACLVAPATRAHDSSGTATCPRLPSPGT